MEEEIELTEEGQKEVERLLNKFTVKLKSIVEEVTSDLYTETLPYIESDLMFNLKEQLISQLKSYKNKHISQHEWRDIRATILKENREEIIKDLNQDMLKEIEDLKSTIEHLQNTIR